MLLRVTWAVEEEDSSLQRTRSCVSGRSLGEQTEPGNQRRIRRHRCSFNGHFYNRTTAVFTPAFGSVTNVRINSSMNMSQVLRVLLNKFKIENGPDEFSLFLLHISGERVQLKKDDHPLVFRLLHGPCEQISKIFLMEPDQVEEVTYDVAQYIKLEMPVLQSFIVKLKEEENREMEKIKQRYCETRRTILQHMQRLSDKAFCYAFPYGIKSKSRTRGANRPFWYQEEKQQQQQQPSIRMGQLCIFTIFCLALMLLLHDTSASKKGTSIKKPTNTKTPTSSNKPPQGSKPQPNYPRQPNQHTNAGSNPGVGHPNQQYPAKGVTLLVGVTQQVEVILQVAVTLLVGVILQVAVTLLGGVTQQVGVTLLVGVILQEEGIHLEGNIQDKGAVVLEGILTRYPAGGGYPVRTAGQPGGFPGGYPSSGGVYPNWNPNNKILSPRYGGGFGGPGYGMGGSPFSKSVHNMGYAPSVKSKGFAKKAMLAAGVGAMAGMAVGYGLGRFPRPHFQFSSPQEEHYYNHYMQKQYGTKSTDTNDYGRDYTFKPPPQAQTYENYMDKCMNRTDLLRDENISSIQGDGPMTEERISERVSTAENATTEVQVSVKSQDINDDTVSITEIGYPALIQQMKARRCVELYMVYSEKFLQKQTQERPSSRSDTNGLSGLLVLLTTAISVLSSALLLK
ncbi:hypothetical protein HF521_002572 [Silurus meridionalis]|uniref:Uncharacterized protein n=1 Tax=Silurus meridionalis TaxID=175797 RepID=A0A8T0B846_SILME|nr:hypothetical protein HF521_002572 [Silurus meridionalis]